MKKIEACKMNHLEKTITMTKKFYNAASILNTPEYVELMTILKEHPDYEMVVRKIAKAEGKKTYRNLTYKHMEEFFCGLKKDEAERKVCLDELEAVKAMSKVQASPYTYVKSWFLENFGEEYNRYTENEEKKAA